MRSKYCSDCGKQGHIFRACMKKNTNVKTLLADEIPEAKEKTLRVINLNTKISTKFSILNEYDFILFKKVPSMFLKVEIEEIPVEFEVDTGSDITTITEND